MVPPAYSSAFLQFSPLRKPLQNSGRAPDAAGCRPEPPLRRPERSERGPRVYNANEVDMASGFRTASRKRSRYRFRVREALLLQRLSSARDYRKGKQAVKSFFNSLLANLGRHEATLSRSSTNPAGAYVPAPAVVVVNFADASSSDKEDHRSRPHASPKPFVFLQNEPNSSFNSLRFFWVRPKFNLASPS